MPRNKDFNYKERNLVRHRLIVLFFLPYSSSCIILKSKNSLFVFFGFPTTFLISSFWELFHSTLTLWTERTIETLVRLTKKMSNHPILFFALHFLVWKVSGRLKNSGENEISYLLTYFAIISFLFVSLLALRNK